MNLREIREEFIKKSGRYDLVDDSESFKDQGADFFIRAGQRFLDKQGDFGTGLIHEFLLSTNAGQRDYVIQDCWNIISLFYSKDSNKKCWEKVERVYSLECDKCRFGSGFFYALIPLKTLPSVQEASAKDLDVPASFYNLSSNGKVEDVRGLKIMLSPEPSETFLLRAIGNFYSKELLADQDVSFWSVYYPETLLKSAMYELEVFYRNSEGSKDWLDALTVDLRNIEQSQLFASIQGDLTMGD